MSEKEFKTHFTSNAIKVKSSFPNSGVSFKTNFSTNKISPKNSFSDATEGFNSKFSATSLKLPTKGMTSDQKEQWTDEVIIYDGGDVEGWERDM